MATAAIPGPALAAALREAALRVARVAQGRSLAAEFGRSRAAVLDLTHGTLRAYRRGPAIVGALSERPAGHPVEALLWCALYALASGRYAEYTVVDQAVRACRLLEKAPAAGYVNGVLRGYLRGRMQLEAFIGADPEARWQHPGWWIEALRAADPAHCEAILEAGNMHPPMGLRVNVRKTTPDAALAELHAQGIAARRAGEVGLVLEQGLPVDRLPGFAAGEVSVQDAGAQRAAPLLELADGQRVLDACAAPGGKAGHILELADVALTALEVERERCGRIGENLRRLDVQPHVAPKVIQADAGELSAWWDGLPYHRVLLDAPCSSSGIVRRRPDIKWLRRADDLRAYAAKQGALLDALWRVLAPDGKLLYATCSVFPAENESVVEQFCARTPGARRLEPQGTRAQVLPNTDHDGFFYALLEKRP